MSAARIGELRARLVLEAPNLAADGAGGSTRTWSAVDTIWGAVRPLRAREQVIGDKSMGLLSHEIEIRYRGDITTRMRFRLGARAFYISAFYDPDGRRARLICKCQERDL